MKKVIKIIKKIEIYKNHEKSPKKGQKRGPKTLPLNAPRNASEFHDFFLVFS